MKPSDYRNMYEALITAKQDLRNSLQVIQHSIERFEHTADKIEPLTVSDEQAAEDHYFKKHFRGMRYLELTKEHVLEAYLAGIEHERNKGGK